MTFEFGIIAALFAMLFWGVGDFLIQRSARRIGDLESLAIIGIVGSIGILPFIFSEIQQISLGTLYFLIFVGIFTFIVSIANYEALKRGKLSVIDVILCIELPITVVLGLFLFQEKISMIQFAAIAVIFLGVLLISFKRSGKSKGVEKGVLLALVVAVGYAFMNYLTALGSRNISPLMIIWFPWFVFSLISLVIISKNRGIRKFYTDVRRLKYFVITMGVIDTIAWVSYAVALNTSQLSITTAITESYPAIALFLGYWFNKERLSNYQFTGAFITILASLALAFII